MMDVENGYFARRPEGGRAVPAIGRASDWSEAGPTPGSNGGAVADLPQDGPEDSARGDEKFGVDKEILFDFRDYGLD